MGKTVWQTRRLLRTCRIPYPQKSGFRHGKRQHRDSFRSRKKNGCAGNCFLLPFPARACSMFPAARGKAAGMLTLRELKNMAETATLKQKMPTVREGKWRKRRDSGLPERLCRLPCGQVRNRIPHPCMQRVQLRFLQQPMPVRHRQRDV